jgi:hypothetical protein
MATTRNTPNDSDSTVPETDYSAIQYEETSRKSYPSQQAVADSWAEGKYPTHNADASGAILYTGTPQSENHPYNRGRRSRSRGANSANWSSRGARGTNCNFYGVQHDDGSGTLWHYSTREAIRTKDNVVISNQQCWATGFAHCSTPDNVDYRVPFEAVEEHLNSGDSVFDIEGVMGQPETTTRYSDYNDEFETSTRTRARNSVVLVNGSEQSYGIYLGRDASIINGESNFSFRLSAKEVQALDAASDALDLLVPYEVAQSDYEVVPSQEYTKTHLDEAEREAHTEAGGTLVKSQSRYRDEMQNRQLFRADLQGNVIVRHGEWFFLPTNMTGDDIHEQGTYEASQVLDSHRPQRFHGSRMPLPTDCPLCDSTSFEETDDSQVWVCDNGHQQKLPIYVNGTVRHTNNDHNAINLGDKWHRAIQHHRDVRTYDDNPSNGGGGGWD